MKLIDEEKTSIEEVTNNLLAQKFGTNWAEKTNQFAIDYAIHLGEVYGDSWYKGFLPKEFFMDILLPSHPHSMTKENLFFPIDTPVRDAYNLIEKFDTEYAKECKELIHYLKEEIKEKGFTSSIVLAVINGTVKHVDGLHRMIAYALLLKEGHSYEPIPVFLCDSTK